ncbi:acyl carrier protein [Algibacter sp. AS12]|uniref:acyl carrier protein n=1 Tax=Algibacter sp. AS12 TaxID=3135773 RepID=UPI00398AF654
MNNKLLISVFKSTLEIGDDIVIEDLKYQGIPEWDSINHMYLISEIETIFDIEIDNDDVLEIKSFKEAQQVLIKHNIEF